MRALTTGELKTSVETRERSARALASAPTKSPALLGEGGMGKVWRAHHSGLKRDDALKVLPDAFAAEPDRLARFRREAQVLASLNHPNIAHVYGLEQSDDVQALVMELVEGPTLADRITQGPIPIDEALPIAKQIAEALEGAHERGIILVSWAGTRLAPAPATRG